MDEPVKKLEARIVELEQKLSQFSRRPEPTNISAEEVQSYQKVRDSLIGDLGEGGGPLERWGGGGCIPCIRPSWPCYVCRPCRPCINECVCGPCIIGGGGGLGGIGNFGGFGG